jgi:hypothetical protein
MRPNGSLPSITRPASARARSASICAAAGIGLVAFAVRIRGALEFAFWQDEVGAAQAMLERTPIDVALFVARFESTPPAYYVLGWAVHNLGVPLEEVRIASALAGALLASGVVLYGRLVVSLWASVLAGLSVALGYQFVFHGRELRSYELHALLCLGIAWAALAFVRSPDRLRGAALALCVAAGSLTNYFFLLSAATVLLWCWGSRLEREVQRRMTWAIAVGLLPFVVWLPAMVKQYGHRGVYTYISSFDLDEVVSTYWSEFVRERPTGALHSVVPILVLAGVLAGSVRLTQQSSAGRLTALMATVPATAAALVWLAGPRIYDTRNMIGAAPFAAIALAALVSSLRSHFAALAAFLASMLIVLGFVRSDRVEPVAYDGVAQALVELGWSPTDPIVVRGSFYAFRGPLEWYLPNRPRLARGGAGSTSCPRLYIVAPGVALTREVLAASSEQRSRRVHGLVVARIEPQSAKARHALLHGSHLLVAANGRTRCVRTIPVGAPAAIRAE